MASKVKSHLDEIYERIDGHKNFVVNGGAGSGKTYALIQSLQHIFSTTVEARRNSLWRTLGEFLPNDYNHHTRICHCFPYLRSWCDTTISWKQ